MTPKHSNSDVVKFARDFAMLAHEGQTRKFSGLPYFSHVERVALTIAMLQTNIDLVAAAYLHDVDEDTAYRVEDSVDVVGWIGYQFSPVVQAIVEQLTNKYTKDKYPDLNRKERHDLEAVRLSNVSYSAKLIKLADRLDNIQSFRLDDPTFGLDHYYVAETRNLVEALSSECVLSLGLIDQILELIDFERNPIVSRWVYH